MNNRIASLISFAIGVMCGAVVAWKMDIRKKETANVADVYYYTANDEGETVWVKNEEHSPEQTVAKSSPSYSHAKPSIREYINYCDFAKGSVKKEEVPESEEQSTSSIDESEKSGFDSVPQVISPGELGENEDYDIITYNYHYSDGRLSDEDDREVEDIEGTIGLGALNTFGRYEDDAVYVRNDAQRCYYEILLDHKAFSEVRKERPREVD